MKNLPAIARFICAACLFAAASPGQSPVTLTIDPHSAGPKIPDGFLGISFETSNLLPQRGGEYLFDPGNRELVSIFRTLGIRSLRMGGSTADMPRYAVPAEADVDRLFAFASAAGVKVIYTLRLPAADIARNAAIAAYIERRYGSQLACFEIGNEPDFYRRNYRDIPDYETYRGLWKRIADSVSNAAPGARFCGPAAGGTTEWSRRMAADFGASGRMAAIVMHEYPGGDGALLSGAPARDAMLSRAWIESYDRLFTSFALDAQKRGLPYRLEETNNFTGGAKDATDTFTAALWALDYLHWWAARGAAGLNFHNRRWILNTTIYPVSNSDDGVRSGYRLHPIAYGLKAFDAGGHGTVLPVRIVNPDAVNLTAYAVRNGGEIYVTIVNKKDPGVEPRPAEVQIEGCDPVSRAAVMRLSAPANDAAAKDGITLGGSPLAAGSWDGKWAPLAGDASGAIRVDVPGTSAVIVRIAQNSAK